MAAGYTSVVALMLVYFWTQHALWDLFYANVIWPTQHYSAVNVVPYAQGIIRGCWDHFVIAKSRLSLDHRHRVRPDRRPSSLSRLLPALLPALAARSIRNRRSAGNCTLLAVWNCIVALGVSPQGYLPSCIRVAAADNPVRLLSPAVPGEGCGVSFAGSCHKRHLSGWLQSLPGPVCASHDNAGRFSSGIQKRSRPHSFR